MRKRRVAMCTCVCPHAHTCGRVARTSGRVPQMSPLAARGEKATPVRTARVPRRPTHRRPTACLPARSTHTLAFAPACMHTLASAPACMHTRGQESTRRFQRQPRRSPVGVLHAACVPTPCAHACRTQSRSTRRRAPQACVRRGRHSTTPHSSLVAPRLSRRCVCARARLFMVACLAYADGYTRVFRSAGECRRPRSCRFNPASAHHVRQSVNSSVYTWRYHRIHSNLGRVRNL